MVERWRDGTEVGGCYRSDGAQRIALRASNAKICREACDRGMQLDMLGCGHQRLAIELGRQNVEYLLDQRATLRAVLNVAGNLKLEQFPELFRDLFHRISEFGLLHVGSLRPTGRVRHPIGRRRGDHSKARLERTDADLSAASASLLSSSRFRTWNLGVRRRRRNFAMPVV